MNVTIDWNSGLKKTITGFVLCVAVKSSVYVRYAETPVQRWKECVPLAVLTAVSAPVHLHPTLCTPARLHHPAKDPTGYFLFICGFLLSKSLNCLFSIRFKIQPFSLYQPSCCSSVSSMSEDDDHESGCETVEGSPTSNTSTSPRGNSPYCFLDNSNRNSRPTFAAVGAPLPSPAVQGRSPRDLRTMVVPPMRVQNNITRGSRQRFQRPGSICHTRPFGVVFGNSESIWLKCNR